jgi:hypothetical protein
MVSEVGEREKTGVWAAAFSGGKEVWRRGWADVAEVVEVVEVVESMGALRRFRAGAEDGMSDCLRFWG